MFLVVVTVSPMVLLMIAAVVFVDHRVPLAPGYQVVFPVPSIKR
jgi:hypothetical protein